MIENRDKLLGCKVTNSEMDLVEEAARKMGKKKSDYMRDTILPRAKKDLVKKGK